MRLFLWLVYISYVQQVDGVAVSDTRTSNSRNIRFPTETTTFIDSTQSVKENQVNLKSTRNFESTSVDWINSLLTSVSAPTKTTNQVQHSLTTQIDQNLESLVKSELTTTSSLEIRKIKTRSVIDIDNTTVFATTFTNEESSTQPLNVRANQPQQPSDQTTTWNELIIPSSAAELSKSSTTEVVPTATFKGTTWPTSTTTKSGDIQSTTTTSTETIDNLVNMIETTKSTPLSPKVDSVTDLMDGITEWATAWMGATSSTMTSTIISTTTTTTTSTTPIATAFTTDIYTEISAVTKVSFFR